ncbi:hypothetical protein [Haloplanus salinarum]|uniref:hypothetical protein n=1 Tax=Haloplanus salinarum TaxID=1912324 RepID=UPI00214CE8CE|nr:hypothetical protein [Haloplanus salinarum]
MFQFPVESLFEWLRTWSGIIGSLGSLVLSFFLVLLYRQQKDILDEQRKLRESEQKAVLRVEKYSFLRGSDAVPFLEHHGIKLEEAREFFVHTDFSIYISQISEKAPLRNCVQ